MKLLNNEKGFTLVESLLSLLIFMIISAMLAMILSVLLSRVYEQSIHPFEWENFIKQAQMDLREAENWKVEEDKILFTMIDGGVASYEIYKALLRRQVAGTGHEVLLQNVSQMKCEVIVDGVEIHVTDTSGNVFKRKLIDIADIEVK